jgi:hypothetical protein
LHFAFQTIATPIIKSLVTIAFKKASNYIPLTDCQNPQKKPKLKQSKILPKKQSNPPSNSRRSFLSQRECTHLQIIIPQIPDNSLQVQLILQNNHHLLLKSIESSVQTIKKKKKKKKNSLLTQTHETKLKISSIF